MPGPVSAWMGDHLQVGKLSRYVTSQPGQLSLASRPWVGAMRTSLGWEGNHRSGVALAMLHRQVVYPPMGSTAYFMGDEHPTYTPGVWHFFTVF